MLHNSEFSSKCNIIVGQAGEVKIRVKLDQVEQQIDQPQNDPRTLKKILRKVFLLITIPQPQSYLQEIAAVRSVPWEVPVWCPSS